MATRGGGIYIHNSDDIEIENCLFVNNAATKPAAASAWAIRRCSEQPRVYVCKSTFISNTAQKGGAVHNHEGATTYMVNCYITGNESTQEGGGVFNSRHTSGQKAVMHMHNCLIGGNVAGTDGGGVFNGLTNNDPNTNEAEMEMVHCTLVGNYADGSYGGALNVASDSALRFYNSITRDNTSDGIADVFKNQIYHVAGYQDSPHDADNFVADGTLPSIYEPSMNPPTWTAGDPVFTEDGSSTVTWTACVYDPDTGETTFTTSNPGSAAAGMLFQPDGPETPMLIISSVGSTSIVCLGWRTDAMSVNITGNLYDLHIDDSGSAWDFGHTDYVPFDFCELDGITTPPNDLPWDLDEDTREVNDPDCGVYEIQ